MAEPYEGGTTETSYLDRILQQIQKNQPSSLTPPSDMSTRTDIGTGLLAPKEQPKESKPWLSDLMWEGTLPKISPEELEYRISELRADMTPVEGQYRSGKRSVQESAKAEGLLSQGKYWEAMPHGIWAGVEALDTALSAPWLLGGILSTPLDLARMFKNLKSVRPVPKKVYGGEGAYLGPDKKELTGSFTEGRVNVEDGIKFGVGKPTASIIDDKSAGNKVKVNLFKQRAGWKWVGKPPVDTPTIISVEQGNKHYYTLDSDIGNVDLTKYPNQPSEPRLRPSSRGDLKFGEEVGKINIRGKLHPVYDTIEVVPRKINPSKANESAFINKFLNNPNAAFWNKTELDKIKTEAGYGAEYVQDTFRAVRKANLKATIRKMKKDGWEVSHTSKHNGKVSSYYMNKGGFDGTTIRVSDHELPETAERMHNRQTFGKPDWDEEIIINSKSSIEEIKTVIKDHLEWFNDV